MQNTFSKEEKLKKSKLIELLFAKGNSISKYPIKLIYLPFEHNSPYKIQAGVSVSKKKFNKAVDRNRIKRLLREVYRLNKNFIYDNNDTKKHLFMFIYIGKKELVYSEIEQSMKSLLEKFLQKNKKLKWENLKKE